MTEKDLSKAKNPDMRGSLAAMRRAAQMAREIAIQTNTAIVIVVDGKLRRVTADELRAGAFRIDDDGAKPPGESDSVGSPRLSGVKKEEPP